MQMVYMSEKKAVNELFQKAHGNSKQRGELYNRTYPSVI